jgi:hypothetical protein
VTSPTKSEARGQSGRRGTLTGLSQGNSGSGFAQQVCSHNRTREVDLLWMSAKSLVHIDATLGDLLVLQQQEVDLLRRLVERSTQS